MRGGKGIYVTLNMAWLLVPRKLVNLLTDFNVSHTTIIALVNRKLHDNKKIFNERQLVEQKNAFLMLENRQTDLR